MQVHRRGDIRFTLRYVKLTCKLVAIKKNKKKINIINNFYKNKTGGARKREVLRTKAKTKK